MRYPIVGTLHKGSPKIDGKVGRDLNYFRFEPEGTPERKKEIAQAFYEAYGDKPDRINIMFMVPTAEEAFDPYFVEYRTSKAGNSQRLTQCDGVNIVGYRDPKNLRWIECADEPLPCRKEPGEVRCEKCRPQGIVQFVIPEIFKAGHAGLVKMTITGIYDHMELQANLKAIESTLAAADASLAFAKLVLFRRDQQVNMRFQNKDGTASSRTDNKSLLHVDLEPSFAKSLFVRLLDDGAIAKELPPAQETLPSASTQATTATTQPQATTQSNASDRRRIGEKLVELGVPKEDYATVVETAKQACKNPGDVEEVLSKLAGAWAALSQPSVEPDDYDAIDVQAEIAEEEIEQEEIEF